MSDAVAGLRPVLEDVGFGGTIISTTSVGGGGYQLVGPADVLAGQGAVPGAAAGQGSGAAGLPPGSAAGSRPSVADPVVVGLRWLAGVGDASGPGQSLREALAAEKISVWGADGRPEPAADRLLTGVRGMLREMLRVYLPGKPQPVAGMSLDHQQVEQLLGLAVVEDGQGGLRLVAAGLDHHLVRAVCTAWAAAPGTLPRLRYRLETLGIRTGGKGGMPPEVAQLLRRAMAEVLYRDPEARGRGNVGQWLGNIGEGTAWHWVNMWEVEAEAAAGWRRGIGEGRREVLADLLGYAGQRPGWWLSPVFGEQVWWLAARGIDDVAEVAALLGLTDLAAAEWRREVEEAIVAEHPELADALPLVRRVQVVNAVARVVVARQRRAALAGYRLWRAKQRLVLVKGTGNRFFEALLMMVPGHLATFWDGREPQVQEMRERVAAALKNSFEDLARQDDPGPGPGAGGVRAAAAGPDGRYRSGAAGAAGSVSGPDPGAGQLGW